MQVRYEYSDSELTHLMAYDADAFNRWEAGQALASRVLHGAIESVRARRAMEVAPAFIEAMGRVISDGSRDPAFAAECLQLPSEGYLAECMEVADPDAIHIARMRLVREIATKYGN